ncbi:CRISPR-associated endonuclease Cas2 [Spirochaetia bacterium 38H-sp]|uniref:CRISPR-associated endoribonuclease Cas2 n=1 Tax=Rarispira pelagica TaxID=3141764 RepID=A0ABU9U8M9_9SPIR
MLRLICYDIKVDKPKRLRQIASICERYGIRLQKSCFQVDADDERFKNLLKELRITIDPKKDSIVAYSICEDCIKLSRLSGPEKFINPDEVIFL